MRSRERFLARRNFADPSFIVEIFRLVQRYIGELFAEGAPPRVVHETQKVHDAVCKRLQLTNVNVFDLPRDSRFPDRGLLTVSETVSALIALDSLANKARYLIQTLDQYMFYLTKNQHSDSARAVAMLAIQLRRTVSCVGECNAVVAE